MLGTEDSITLTIPRGLCSVLRWAIFTAIGVAAFNFVSQKASWAVKDLAPCSRPDFKGPRGSLFI